MVYVKINGTLYPATIDGKMADREWDNRESKAITLEMGYAEANALFADGLEWSIVQQYEVPIYEVDENGEYVMGENNKPIQIGVEYVSDTWDNSEFSVAGSITDHRNGTVTAKMGKITDSEALAELMEVLA